VGNSQQKLFGGAQYHRTMREFTIAVRHMASQLVTEDEISNAAGNLPLYIRIGCIVRVNCIFLQVLTV
jgi:hypothetical protein